MDKLEAIYLDLDGVLVDFVTPALALHGRLDLLDPEAWPKGMYSMESALGITKAEFWRPIHEAGFLFWAGLPEYSWMWELITLAREKAKKVVILSTPSEHPSSSFGKHFWVYYNLGVTFRNFSITPLKSDVAKPGRVLIDDYDKNCDEWAAAGGTALLFPQIWNRGSGNINTVLDALGAL